MKKLLAALAFACALPMQAAGAGTRWLQGEWLDDQGRRAQLEALDGAPLIVTMAYGSCQRVCSSVLRTMKVLQTEADRRRQAVQFVVIGLDPTQDTPADWAAFRRDHGLSRTNWHFLSGRAADVARLARWLNLRYWRYGEHVLHDYRIVSLAPGGLVRGSLETPDQDPYRLLD